MSECYTGDKALRFLLVEDDIHVADLFATVFQLLDYEIKIVTSASQALTWAPDLRPDIIYTNLLFGDMTGFELCARLRQIPELSDTRIIAVTGLKFPALQDVCRAAGFNECLAKPFTLEELASTISPAAAERIRLVERRLI